MLIDQIASDNVLETAFQWMCEKRAHHHFNSDVWQVRRWWIWVKCGVDGLLECLGLLGFVSFPQPNLRQREQNYRK